MYSVNVIKEKKMKKKKEETEQNENKMKTYEGASEKDKWMIGYIRKTFLG